MPIALRLLPLVLLLALGCGPTLLQRSTTAFAGVTDDGTDALAPGADAAGALCRRQERISWLRGRIDENWRGPATLEAAWLDRRGRPDDGDAADRPCAMRAKQAETYRRALSVLAGYGSALSALAGGGAYDGSGLTSGTAALAAIAGSAGAGDLAKEVIGKIGSPLGAFAEWALRRRADAEIRVKVRESAPAFTGLLELVELHVRLNDEQLARLRTTWSGTAAIAADRLGLVAGKSDAHAAVAFFEMVRREHDALEEAAAAQRAMTEAIQDMREAHGELVAALTAEDKATADAHVKKLIALAVDLARLVPSARARRETP